MCAALTAALALAAGGVCAEELWNPSLRGTDEGLASGALPPKGVYFINDSYFGVWKYYDGSGKALNEKLDLFAGNIVDNIAVGEFHPNIERIIEICKTLGMLPFIEKMPGGLNTYIGENGATLSGGQKQRIAIARALYRNPEILVFDEATSSLDSESEYFVQEAINQMKAEGKTVIVIAHRLSTVVNADKIAVLENGKLIEEGSHTQLWEAKGKYYQMWQKQLPIFSKLKHENLLTT